MNPRAATLALLLAGCASTAPAERSEPARNSSVSLANRSERRARSRACSPDFGEPELIRKSFDVPVPELVDGSFAMKPFYAALASLLEGTRNDSVRIAVYGDSNMTEDLISGEMRRVLQKRHGDAGHGYVAFGKPWTWYRHMDVVHDLEPKAWKSLAVSTHATSDQCYGFGGIAADSLSGRARAWVETAAPASPVGTRVSRIDVFYLERPKGGRFTVRVDGKETAEIDTSAIELDAGFRRIEVPDGPHRIGFVAEARVRLFGVALERSEPGIVVDSLGVGGANEVLLARMNPANVKSALRHRAHDLVIFLTGATENDDENHDRALGARIGLMREALPNASLLVMSPPDFAYGGRRHPRASKRMARLGKRKRVLAAKMGTAFWDFHAAMGGELSIARFADAGMAHSDLAHLNERGAAYMARRIVYTLWKGFVSARCSE